MAKKYNNSQNTTMLKTYCQNYGVAFLKVNCNFQNNKTIDTIYILVKKYDKLEIVTLTQTQIIQML